MNEYQKFIEYINNKLNNIDKQIEQEQHQNEQQAQLKIKLENIIEKLNNHLLQEIDLNEMNDILIFTLGTEKANIIIERFKELINLSIYLFNDSIINPLKKSMLNDYEQIKEVLHKIKENLKIQPQLSEQLIKQKEQLEKYKQVMDELGYHKLLTNTERTEFYEFLKECELEENIKLILIKNYINYALKNKQEEKIYTSYSAIDIINANAREVFLELESEINEEIQEQNLELIDLTANDLEKTNNELSPREQEIYQQILNLIKEHEQLVDKTKYKLYKNSYSDQDILTILESKSSFLGINGIDWNKVIPLLKEKLIPMINSNEREVVFNIFEKILKFRQEQLTEEANRKKQIEQKYKERLENFKVEITKLMNDVTNYRTECSNLIVTISEKLNDSQGNFSSILNQIKFLTKEEFYQSFPNYSDINYNQCKSYILLSELNDIMDYIKEFIELEISLDDFDEIEKELIHAKEIKKEFIDSYKLMLEDFKKTKKEPLTKQYEYGNTVILFYRKNEFSKFLVEEDLEEQRVSDNDKLTYGDIYQILKRTSETTKTEWSYALNDHSHFKSTVDYNKRNGKKGDPVTLESDFSHITYTYYRYKDRRKTIPRLTGFDIQMSDENRKKLNIPQEKNIVLFINEHQVTKHSIESQEYSDIIRKLKNNSEDIKKFIALLEDPNTPSETLYQILNDSSDLYDKFVKKGKGLG